MKVKDLRERIILYTDDKLIKYIDEEYGQNNSNSVHKFRGNMNTLKKLDKDSIILGISRMKKIEDYNDYSKFVPILVTLLIALIGAYSGLFGFLSKNVIIQNVTNFALIFYIVYLLSNSIAGSKRKRSQAIYFRNLLESVLKNNFSE